MVTDAQLHFLSERGWPVGLKWFDLCWMDCDRGGMLKTWKPPHGKALCVCLCPEHAVLLEEGVYAGDYTGAPLPKDSMADEWPWQYCEEAGVE